MTRPTAANDLTVAVRAVIGLAALGNAVLAAGLVANAGWVLRWWPWETGRLSHLFLASMLAALAAGAGWIAASGEAGSLPAGFLNLTITTAGIAGWLATRVEGYGATAAVLGILAAVNLLLYLVTSRRWPAPGAARTPALVHGSFAAFGTVLLVVGVALLVDVTVMPWPVEGETRVVFGWIFLGDAAFFLEGVRHRVWPASRAQLWAFLGYDVVLLPPLLLHLREVEGPVLLRLVVYLAVLLFSAVLAIRYLLLDPATRGWGDAGVARASAR
ncbi:hypothetical protein [Egicoccus sp. AB-alg2]|uniref:hypothetical protein n=1 Tax=Egicoccus sp. AB-alg2 TaxID=3242693 RepID=UPI00359DD51F